MRPGTEVPYETLNEAPLGEEFLAFMSQRGEDAGRHPEIRDWLETEFETASERLLASFALISTGCWNRGKSDVHVAGHIVEQLDTIHHVQDSNLQSRLAAGIQGKLEDIDSSVSRWDWLHNHRKSIHFQLSQGTAGHAVVDSLVGLADVVGGYADIAEYVQAKVDEEHDPFYSIFSDTEPIDEFSRLSAFDFLEIADTSGGVTGITPQEPRFEYVQNNNPQPGFLYVFLADGPEDDSVKGMDWDEAKQQLGVDEDGLDKLVKLLCEEAQSRLNWGEELVMYDVESCLCIFAKDANNRMLSLGGENNDCSSTGSGC